MSENVEREQDTGGGGTGPSLPSVEGYRSDIIEVARVLGSDDFVASVVAANIRLEQELAAQRRRMAELVEAVEGDAESVGDFPIDMSNDVPADTTDNDDNTVVRKPKEDGPSRIIGVTLGWPDGAQSAVGIQLRTDDGLVLLPRNPEDDYLAFNDFTETFPVDYRLSPGEDIVAQMVNFDTTNSHFVNIVPHIEELDEEAAEMGVNDGGG